MKFVIIYKYKTTDDKMNLEQDLERLSSIISSYGHETFIFDKDIKRWQQVDVPREEAFPLVFEAIKSCNAVIAFVTHSKLSEGMHMEAGYAKALNKKIILAVKKGELAGRMKAICDTYLEYTDFEDLTSQLIPYLNSAFAVSQ